MRKIRSSSAWFSPEVLRRFDIARQSSESSSSNSGTKPVFAAAARSNANGVLSSLPNASSAPSSRQ